MALQPDAKIVASGIFVNSDYSRDLVVSRHYGGDDDTLPDPVTAFTYELQNPDASLSWTNPTVSDFEATRILRSTGEYATNATQTTDQTKVYEGTATSYKDTGFANGTTYYYTAFARDTSGNWSAAAKVLIDLVPPDTKIYAAPMPTHNLPVSFSFQSSEADSTFECKLDDGTFSSCTSPLEYTDLTDGSHTFEVRAKDASGNIDPTPDSFTWTVDTKGPETTIDSGPSGTVSAGSARFEFSSEAGTERFICELDGSQTICDSPKEYTDLGTGEHTFQVQADDAAGNRSPAASRTWRIEPDKVSESVTAGSTVTTGDTATSSDPVETSITSPVAGTISITETPSTTEQPVGYALLGQQVDITAPTATPENPLRFVFRLDSSLVPQGEDQNAIQIFRYSSFVENCTDPSSTTASPDPCVSNRSLLGDGDIEFTILTSKASPWNFGVVSTDKVVPTGSVLINNGAASTRKSIVKLTLSATDDEGGTGVKQMRFSNDSKKWSAWEPYTTSKTWTLTKGTGPRTVYAEFRDGAGNSVRAKDTIRRR